MYTLDINFVVVILAAIASMALGMIWYSPIGFGKKWMSLVGVSVDAKPKGAMKSYFLSFFAAIIMAYVLSLFIINAPPVSISSAIQIAFWVWIGFVATTNISEYLFSPTPKPMALFVLNAGYHLASLMTMAIVISIWG
ncbi:MAG TPA: DUF1761 domain-containing protein [Candidatus Paceibacterota bacterium]